MIHILMLGFAFLLRYLSPHEALLCAVGACLFNLFFLPRFGAHRIFREFESKPIRSGPFYYSISVLVLILLFPRQLYIVAAAWGVMALGDGSAGVCWISTTRLWIPWNPRKTFAGTIAFVLFGSIGASVLLFWTLPSFPQLHLSPATIIGLSCTVSLCCAIIESLPWKINDNLSVPLAAGLLFYLLIETSLLTMLRAYDFWIHLGVGLLINILLALIAWFFGWVRASGCLAGILIGTLIFGFQGWRGWAILLCFFVFGSLSTQMGYDYKRQLGISQTKRGARGTREILANGIVPAALSILAAVADEGRLFLVGFTSALAAATADTVSSEIGQWLGGEPFLVTNFARVPRGSNGAVTLKGTLAGVLAALTLSLIAFQLGLVDQTQVWLVQAASLIGNLMDSFLGATIEGTEGINNEIVNFLNTLTGAGVGIALGGWIQ
ncbi:MAG: hypothetical protein DMG05_04200 [Acidobacteria bacterium]|nr:MAG: hypothetical protein DMG05_04200 [Acidobacteriota bacterium]